MKTGGVLQRRAVLAVAMVLSLASGLSAQTERSAILDRLGQIRRESGAPGVTAAVAKDGRLIFSGGVGYADLQNQSPASGITVHNIASVSTAMTTVAVMRLVEQGKVSLDAGIQEYVPSLPESTAPVTVRQILMHTSGLRNSYGLTDIDRIDELWEAIAQSDGEPLLFEPGAFWSYSSHAFNLLQGMIETTSGVGFEDYMRTHVWEPAGMFRSSFDLPRRIVPGRGRGYERDDAGTFIHSPYRSHRYRYASGGMLSTAEDLVRLGIAINDGTLLTPATVAVMHASQMDPAPEYMAGGEFEASPIVQAIGWRIGTDVTGRSYVYHAGTVSGVGSVLINYPDEGLVVALMANVLPFDPREHGQTIAQMFLP